MSESTDQTDSFALDGEQSRQIGNHHLGTSESNTAAIKILDLDGKLLTMNATGLCLMEIDDFSEFEGRFWANFWSGEEYEKATNAVAAAQRGKVAHFDGFAATVKGTRKLWEVTVSPIIDLDGQPKQILAISRAIGEEQRTEEKIRESEQNYRTLFDSIDEGFCVIEMIFDANGKATDYTFLELNAAFEKHSGLIKAKGKRLREFVPDYEDFWFETYGRVALTGETVRFDNYSEAFDRWWDVYAFRIGDPQKRQVAVLFNDISERKLAERSLQENRQKLDTALKAGKMGSWTLDLKSGELESSDICKINYGRLPKETFTYQDLADSIVPEDFQIWRETVDQAVAQCSDFEIEYRIRWRDDSVHWVLVRGNCFGDVAGKTHSIAGVSIDITDRKKIEEVAHESRKMLEDALDSMAAHISVLDADGTITLVNESWRRFALENGADWTMQDVGVGSNYLDVCRQVTGEDAGDGTAIYRGLRDVLERKSDFFSYEYPCHSPTDKRWFLLTASPLTRESGGAVVAHQNITTKKLAEEAVRESEEKYRTLFEQIDSGFCIIEMIFDDAGEPVNWLFLEANPAFERNNSIKNVAGKTITELAPNIERKWFEIYGRVALTGEPERFIEGSEALGIWFDVYAFRTGMPEERRLAVLFNDISNQKNAETEREKLLVSEQAARAEAENSNRLKDEFLATVSHELRTPLNAILGWSQILQSRDLADGERDKAVATIYRSAKAQSQLIEDILDVSRIITGKLRLNVRAVDLAGVITAAADVARPGADAKDIRLQLLIDPQAGPISGDPERLQQVVWNLLSNAVKFTPKGGRIQVRLERVNSHVEIVVADTGKGIEPEFLPYVFDRFRQSDGSMTRRHGGLGLGLAIVRQIVELHGGAVGVQSNGEDKGTTFTISLPFLPVRQAQASNGARVHPTAESGANAKSEFDLDHSSELAGMRILLVDDEADSRDLLKLVLASCGAEVTEASSAAEALIAAERTDFDLLISDIGMPDEDGFSLIAKIRMLPAAQNGNIPAIALTAYARSEDRIRAIRSGFQMHVAKPVEPAELVAVAANLIK